MIPPPFLPGLYYVNGVGVAVAIFTGTGTPPSPISGNSTVGAQQIWTPFQAVPGGYTLTIGGIKSGYLYIFQHVGGAAGSNLLETPGQAVTLSRGTNTFKIEDPQNRLSALANSVTLGISGSTYEYMLDSTSNVLRCMRQVQ